MKNFAFYGKKLHRLCTCSWIKLAYLIQSFRGLMLCLYGILVFRLNLFWIQLSYFLSLSTVGFLILKVLKTRTHFFRPKDFDMFFMSVSATTVSSMSTIEMEVFSNTQLVVLTILMLIGGEVFISMLEFQWVRFKFKKQDTIENKVDSVSTSTDTNQIELAIASVINSRNEKLSHDIVENEMEIMGSEDYLKYKSKIYLGYVVLGYLIVVLVVGSTLVSAYISLVPSAIDVLKSKGIKISTFSVFTVVSSFVNCGFVPTNENMVVFKKNSGLLLLLIPQLLLGNTLFPSFLRLVIWVFGRITGRREFNYMLKHEGEMGYGHLFPSLHSLLLVVTVFGFILVQFILFACMEWNSEALDGLNSYQKIVGVLFQTVNSRHAGESIVDLSIISPTILALFIAMMYVPPYTSFMPIKDNEKRKGRRGRVIDNFMFSQLSYLVIFVILICITERKKMKDDPLNFSFLNIVIEVISAYGNVGFTTGYSCKRQLNPDNNCKDAWYGFCGRWSNNGKLILILVMFFGRLKKFNMEGGKAWKLM